MKKIISILLLITPVFILIFCSGSTPDKINKIQENTAVNNNIVVLELFTSQGCSSCPPADRLLGKYADKENVFALSFHVDYWNRLGWKDPFSSAAFSQRQSIYANDFGSSGVYTPQVIINGQKEMVGSDEDKIANTVKQFKAEQPAAKIIIDDVKMENNKATFSYSVTGKTDNAKLNIALVQNKITTSIKSGENGGVTLTNYNVVRNFKSIESLTSEKNNNSVDLVSGIDKNNFSLILYLQDKSSNKIYAAAKSSL